MQALVQSCGTHLAERGNQPDAIQDGLAIAIPPAPIFTYTSPDDEGKNLSRRIVIGDSLSSTELAGFLNACGSLGGLRRVDKERNLSNSASLIL